MLGESKSQKTSDNMRTFSYSFKKHTAKQNMFRPTYVCHSIFFLKSKEMMKSKFKIVVASGERGKMIMGEECT